MLLIRPRLLLPSVLYVLIVQDGYFYFCGLGNKPTATAAQEHRYRMGMPEKELLGARGSFKTAAGDVEQILRQTARDPWTAGTGNGGTVWLRIDGREHRYILTDQTPTELLAERLRAGGFARYAVEDNAAPEDDGPAPTRADTRMVRRLGKILGGLTAVGAVWALFLPGPLTGAAALNMLLPPITMVAWWKYRRALRGPRVNTAAASGFAAAAMLPPLILTIRVMSAVHARHITPMLLGLLGTDGGRHGGRSVALPPAAEQGGRVWRAALSVYLSLLGHFIHQRHGLHKGNCPVSRGDRAGIFPARLPISQPLSGAFRMGRAGGRQHPGRGLADISGRFGWRYADDFAAAGPVGNRVGSSGAG